MAGLSLVDALRLVRSGCRLQSSDALFPDAVLTDLINEAVSITEGEVLGPWRQATTTANVSVATPDLPLPADWAESKAVFNGDVELGEASITDLLAYSVDQAGFPSYWAQDADVIRVRPKSSGTYALTLVYYRAPTVLVAPADETLMPRDLAVSLIVPKACELVYLGEGNRIMADAKAQAYATGLPRLRKRARGASRPMRVRIRQGSWI